MQNFIQELQGNFFLRSPKQTTPTLLYYVVRINNKKIRLATGVKIYPQHWDKSKQKAIITPQQPKQTRINNGIVNEKIAEYLKRFSQFKEYLCNNPAEITHGGDLLKSFIYNKMSENCIGYLRKRKDEDKTISEGTKKDYKSALDNLERFCTQDNAVNKFNDFTKKYIKNYYNYLLSIDDNPRTKDGKLSVSYVNKQISQLWNMLNKYAVENELMDYSILLEWQNRGAWEKKDKTKNNEKGIALRDDEIIKLWEYWFHIDNQNDKDILATFLLECLTGQRFSDIEKITYNLNTIHSITTINLTQQKTGKTIRVGIIFELAKIILKQYENKMPQSFSIDYSNKRMKAIGKAAGIVGQETMTRHSGNDTHVQSIQKQRFELLSQHTGRRTFITLLALREWSAHRIKQYSGHSDIDMVERYTKIKDSVEFERFRNAVKNDSSHILRFVDENENNKLFGTVVSATSLCNYPIDRIKFQQEIQEAKEVLAMFGVPAYKFMDSFDIDELRSMMYGIEHNLLKVIKEREVIKAIFNNANKTLEDKARELHQLYLSCKNEH